MQVYWIIMICPVNLQRKKNIFRPDITPQILEVEQLGP